MRSLLIIGCMLVTVSVCAQKQGIKGKVFWVSGNQMPGPGQQQHTPQQGITREICIYNAVTMQQTKRTGQFFSSVDAILITTIQSEADGTFKVKLPPGKYSVFTKESQGLYANSFDGTGCINCITVAKKKYTWITITLDYEAAY